MNPDQPWQIAALIGLLTLCRLLWGRWRRSPARGFLLELFDSGLIAFALVFLLIRPFVVQSFYIPSASMEPTLMGPEVEGDGSALGRQAWSAPFAVGPRISLRSMRGDHILVNKFIYRLTPPRRGDIIVFRAPPQALHGGPPSDFIKRLVGLPGDLIEIRRGLGVFVNGARLREPAAIPLPDYDWPVDRVGLPSGRPYQVPPDCYFVLGDNRNHSYDSHAWQLPDGSPQPELAQGLVLGKAMAIFWPPGRARLLGDSAQVYLPSVRIAQQMKSI